MSWWGDFQDDVLGYDPPAAGLTMQQKIFLWQQQQAAAQAAAEKAETDRLAAEKLKPIDPIEKEKPIDPIEKEQPFDPTPFRAQIDSSFNMFTPEFYSNRFAAINDPYKTHVGSQYGQAKDLLTSGVAKRGLTGSQQGRGLFQQLDQLRDQAYGTGEAAAQGFQTSLADQVNKSKQGFYGEIGAGKDNAGLGARARTEADRIAGTASPEAKLGDIFGELVRPYAESRTPGGPVNPELQAFSTGGNLNLANVGGGPEASTRVVGGRKKKF